MVPMRGSSPAGHQLLVLTSHHISPELFILFDEVFFLLSMLVDLLVLFSDDGCHFLYFLLELTILTVDPNDHLLVCFDRCSGTFGDVTQKVLFGDDL